jgi:pimeloyl-ACP methyl ester carboxylesterase
MSVDQTPIAIPTPRGPTPAIWQPAPGPSRAALLCVGGFDGGFAGPANGLYADLGAALPQREIGVLRLDFRVKRSPGPIDDGTIDVVAGIDWLSGEGVGPVILVGHSYGGAIVLRAGLRRKESVCGVAALSTQTAGIEQVAELAPIPLLLVHGLDDTRLPPRLSQFVFQEAAEPKSLHLLEGATHSLRQKRDELWSILTNWIEATLTAAADNQAN